MTDSSSAEHQPREHPVLCLGVHNLRSRPKTWDVSGYCPACKAEHEADAEQRILDLESRDRALELADSMGDPR